LDERLAIFRLNGVSSTDGNPRGWNVPSIQHDLRDRRIWQAFTRSMTAEARRIIDRLRSERTTGVLVWDLEGRQGEHGLYVGQPDLLPELAPEMDAAADALFRTFMEAGLDTGILLRAERLVRGPRGDWTWDRSVDHGPTLAARAAYAHRRWGCSLFFINNSTLGDVPLAADALAAIRLAVPGARIILERAEPGAEGSATLWVPSPPGPAPTPADGARRAVWLPRQSAPGPDWDPRTDIPLIEVAGMDLGPLSP
jgi:hypothetical protein